MLLLIPKVLNSESNSQLLFSLYMVRYVVVNTKGTEFWKQFTTLGTLQAVSQRLLLIPKVLNSESNSQHIEKHGIKPKSCC